MSVATRVLVIDYDLQILPLLQKGLAFEGFEVTPTHMRLDTYCKYL